MILKKSYTNSPRVNCKICDTKKMEVPALASYQNNDLTEPELNWLKSLGPISETKILDLIGSIMNERDNKKNEYWGQIE
jgi:hypothetical protein